MPKMEKTIETARIIWARSPNFLKESISALMPALMTLSVDLMLTPGKKSFILVVTSFKSSAFWAADKLLASFGKNF